MAKHQEKIQKLESSKHCLEFEIIIIVILKMVYDIIVDPTVHLFLLSLVKMYVE